jgi:hypothetical protein
MAVTWLHADIKHVLRGSPFIFGSMFLLVNPLAATPLFPHVSSVARAALFGLVVYMPRGRTVAPAPDLAERPR